MSSTWSAPAAGFGDRARSPVNITQSEGANDSLVINALGGNDSITATTLPAGVIKLTIDSGAGNDTVFGSQGADVCSPATATTSCSATTATTPLSSAPATTCSSGTPATATTRSKARTAPTPCCSSAPTSAENIDILANGGRALFLRNVANVTMDMDDVEKIDFSALGGADNIVVGDLSGTDVTNVALDLSGLAGGGDGAADTVTVNATQGDEVFAVSSDAVGGVHVTALHTQVDILSAEDANDRLVINGLGGRDVIDATNLAADVIQLTMNGGLGNDVFLGSQDDDLINGGDGNDVAFMAAGDDTFVWNPGDDNDIIEGQAGFDAMLFNGANVAENIGISANGGRALFTRDIANVIMDLNDTEFIDLQRAGWRRQYRRQRPVGHRCQRDQPQPGGGRRCR